MKVKQMLSRVYVNNADEAVEFYEQLFHKKVSSRFTLSKPKLEIINIGDMLIIAGADKELETVRSTRVTLSVDSIHEYKDMLLKNGAVIIRDIKKVPTGWNMTVKHKDGLVAEYVERDVN